MKHLEDISGGSTSDMIIKLLKEIANRQASNVMNFMEVGIFSILFREAC